MPFSSTGRHCLPCHGSTPRKPHERAPFLECVPTPISLLRQIADDVRQRCLGHLSGEVRALARLIAERRAEPVNREIARPGRRERLAALRAGKYEIPNLLDTTSLQMTAAEMHGARHMQCPQMAQSVVGQLSAFGELRLWDEGYSWAGRPPDLAGPRPLCFGKRQRPGGSKGRAPRMPNGDVSSACNSTSGQLKFLGWHSTPNGLTRNARSGAPIKKRRAKSASRRRWRSRSVITIVTTTDRRTNCKSQPGPRSGNRHDEPRPICGHDWHVARRLSANDSLCKG